MNLPSVEVGSVITYTTVTTVTDAPKPFHATWFFDAFEPFDAYDLRVEAPAPGRTLAFDGPKRRVKSEPMQPEGELWRACETISLGDFAAAARRLRPATEVRPAAIPGATTLREIRDWMAKHVRRAGPGLYEVPLAAQLTDPETVLRERYATRLDYVRTLCALLRGAGYRADVVFAAADADDDPRASQRDLVLYPDVGRFSAALCRVAVRTGGFLWWGGETKTYFLGTENEYTPLGATPYARCHYLDPATGELGEIPGDGAFQPRSERLVEIALRANGAADVDVTELTYGPGVGGFRKSYAEMLPEDRSRHFQSLLGELAQAATATRELATDTEDYPAKRTYSAFIPDYATVAGDAMTLAVPAIGFTPFGLTGAVRSTPLGVDAAVAARVTVRVTFPEGYVLPEHLPTAYAFADPATGGPWYDFRAHAWTEDASTPRARARVELVRETAPRRAATLPADYAALLRDWSRTAGARANRTLTVRRRTDR